MRSSGVLFSAAVVIAVAGIAVFAAFPSFRSWFAVLLMAVAGLCVAGVILRNQPPR